MTLAPYRPRSHGADCEAIPVFAGKRVLVCHPDGLELIDRKWFAEYYTPLPEQRTAGERRGLTKRTSRCGGRRRQDRTRWGIRNERWPVEVGR